MRGSYEKYAAYIELRQIFSCFSEHIEIYPCGRFSQLQNNGNLKIRANKSCVTKRFTETISAVHTICEGNLLQGLFSKPKSGQGLTISETWP